MLSSRYRFHGHGSLRFLYAQGRTTRSKALALRCVANSRRADSRLAVVIAKKVLKPAPQRNRVRRRVYEIVRTNWAHIPRGYDILITVYEPRLYDMPHEEARASIIELLRQSNLWLDDVPTSQKS